MNDRIDLACKLLAVLFLVDGSLLSSCVNGPWSDLKADELEDMSLEEGKAYNDSLIATSRGEIPVDRK